VPHGTRLYSIASSRYGDNYDGQTASLCVRRALYTDPETGKEDPAKKGICSNFLCDAAPGTVITMTGERSSCSWIAEGFQGASLRV
jgi:ferredoxin--NADP+ reductase